MTSLATGPGGVVTVAAVALVTSTSMRTIGSFIERRRGSLKSRSQVSRAAVRFSSPESWSSTSLAKKAVLGIAHDIFVFDSPLVLVDASPLSVSKSTHPLGADMIIPSSRDPFSLG